MGTDLLLYILKKECELDPELRFNGINFIIELIIEMQSLTFNTDFLEDSDETIRALSISDLELVLFGMILT